MTACWSTVPVTWGLGSIIVCFTVKIMYVLEVDDLKIKLEYLQQWDVQTESDDTAALFLKYGVSQNNWKTEVGPMHRVQGPIKYIQHAVKVQTIKLVSLLIADRLLCSCDPTQSDSSLEKFGSFFGISSVDHDADVVDQTAIVKVDSPETAMV